MLNSRANAQEKVKKKKKKKKTDGICNECRKEKIVKDKRPYRKDTHTYIHFVFNTILRT